jgi:hypothetical protein
MMRKELVQTKGCPKCHGDIFYCKDFDGPYLSCMQCGWTKDLLAPVNTAAPPKGSGRDPGFTPGGGDLTYVAPCDVADDCLECPLPQCKWDDPMWYERYKSVRAHQYVLDEYDKYPELTTRKRVQTVADATGFTIRTIYRIVAKRSLVSY